MNNKPNQPSTPTTPSRDNFKTHLGVLAATLGSAVGLGNIWKFPSLVGQSGGAAFVFVYIICVLLIGIPVMVSEHVVGRAARSNPVDAFKRLSASKFPWGIIGVMGILGSFLILSFYTEVAGWVLAYIPKAISGVILTTDAAAADQTFVDLITNPTASLAWQWIDLFIVGIIIASGVSKGIERTIKLLIPVLLLLLILVAIRSVTLPGASEGLTFLFKPDLSKLTPSVILGAMGLAFFKLSVGMGVMLTYGSYYPDNQDIPGNAIRVALSDVVIALLAGVAIFPAVFAYNFEPTSGPSLLFKTIPAVFASMPLGNFFLIVFLVLTFVASIGAQVSLVEALTTFLQERVDWPRKKVTLITVIGLLIFGSLAALSNSTLSHITIAGKNFFDLFDYLSSNVLLPLGGMLICLFIGWVWGKPNFETALSNNGTLKNNRVINILFFLIKFISPVLILLVFLNSIQIIK